MTRRLKKPGEAGTTLIELLLVMGLLGIFMTVMVTIFTSVIDVQNQSSAYSATLSDGRFIVARLNYDIMRATSVTTPGSLGATATSLVITVAGNTNTYALSGNNLQLTDNTGSYNLNGNGTTVTGLSFQRLGNPGGKDTIRYSFTLTSTTHHASGNDTQTFSSTTGLR